MTVDRTRIVAGRAPDPRAPNEVAIGEALASQLHVGVGGLVASGSYSPAQIAATLAGAPNVGPPAGPHIRLHVVGIERRVSDLGDSSVAGGLLVFTPAFARTYAHRVGVFGTYVRVRTTGGSQVNAAVVATAHHIFGPALFSSRITTETGGTQSAIDVLTLALWIFAAIVAVTGTLTIAIVLAREVALLSREHDTLRSLGATRTERIGVCMPAVSIAVFGGVLVAVAGAIAASPLYPLGVARRADPDVGLHGDLTVLAVGAAALVITVTAIAFGAAIRATRPMVRMQAGERRSSRPKPAARLASIGLPPPLSSGVRLALDAGRGRTRLPVRSAIAGAVLAVMGVTAVLVFATNVDQLVKTPSRFGWTWDLESRDTTSNTPCGASTYGVERIPGLSAVAEICYEGVRVDGRAVEALSFRPLRGSAISPVVLTGRAPIGRREVVLGHATLRALGKHVGDTVQIAGRRTQLRYRVVGEAVFPTLGQSQPIADGAAFTGAGFTPLFDQNVFSRYFVGRVAPGASEVAVARRIGRVPQLSDATGVIVPVEVARLRQISWFPTALAVLFGALGLVAVGYALVSTVRRRRSELMVLKALGFDRRQVRATFTWQATTMALVGLLLGIPLGIVTGTVAWRLVADGLGVAPDTLVPALGIAAIVPATLVLCGLAAYLPGRAAARAPAAVALRST